VHRKRRTGAPGAKSASSYSGVEEEHAALQPSLQIGELARSEMVTTLIAQMSDWLAPISKSTTRA
jgi:hypothetical protein